MNRKQTVVYRPRKIESCSTVQSSQKSDPQVSDELLGEFVYKKMFPSLVVITRKRSLIAPLKYIANKKPSTETEMD